MYCQALRGGVVHSGRYKALNNDISCPWWHHLATFSLQLPLDLPSYLVLLKMCNSFWLLLHSDEAAEPLGFLPHNVFMYSVILIIGLWLFSTISFYRHLINVCVFMTWSDYLTVIHITGIFTYSVCSALKFYLFNAIFKKGAKICHKIYLSYITHSISFNL